MAIKKAQPHTPRRTREIVVDVAAQTLSVMDGPSVTAEFPVSTSRFGLGFEEGSFRTPTGRFIIREKIGDGAPPWTVFRARENTGQTTAPGGEEDLVLTRILTLDGLEPANTNTLERFHTRRATCHWTEEMGKYIFDCLRANFNMNAHWCHNEAMALYCGDEQAKAPEPARPAN